jgi:hypothetical protein
MRSEQTCVFLLLLPSFHFFTCSLSFILRFFLSHFLYFISSLPRASTSYIYLHISSHPFFIHQSCLVRPFPFFTSSCLSLFLSFHSFNRSYFYPLLYKFSAFSRLFHSFLFSYYVFSSFISCIRISLFTLGRLYSHFPSFDTNIFLPFPFHCFIT